MIELGIGLEQGWKKEENNRFGDALVINFFNSETKEVIFKYAPKINEILFWKDSLKLLEEYDLALKQLRTVTEKIENLNKNFNRLASLLPCKSP